jgi:hypothetical protein
MYHGSASFRGRSGQVVVTVNGVATVTGNVPIGACVQQNFNPYVFSASSPNSDKVLNINSHVCVAGFGLGAFASICKFSCALGYCPVTGENRTSSRGSANTDLLDHSLHLLEDWSPAYEADRLAEGWIPYQR